MATDCCFLAMQDSAPRKRSVFLLTLVAAVFLSPTKIRKSNIHLTAAQDYRGILEENASTQKRWKSSKIRHSRGVKGYPRRTLFGTPKRKAPRSSRGGRARKCHVREACGTFFDSSKLQFAV